MTEPVENSKIFVPLGPSIRSLTLIREAIQLYREFPNETLSSAFRRIQLGLTEMSDDREDLPELSRCKRAQRKLLILNPCNRSFVIFEIYRLILAAEQWKADHSHILQFEDGDCTFSIRSDGTVDSTKSAQHLVMNERIDIRQRFDLACMYCLVESVQKLWKEMNKSFKLEKYKSAGNSVVRFWIRWIHCESHVPWKQAALEFFSRPRDSRIAPRFSSFLPSFLPEERKELIACLKHASNDDRRFCMYALTADEEAEMLKDKWFSLNLLQSYLEWPLKHQFLETATKMWNYMDLEIIFHLLNFIYLKHIYDVIDYSDIFRIFYNDLPNHLKEKIRECPYMMKNIDLWYNKMRSVKNSHFEEHGN